MGKYIFQDYVNVRINTCICKMLYQKLGKDKSNSFVKAKERKTSYKSFEEVVSYGEINISKSKVMRILEGGYKSRYTKDEVSCISQKFNVDKKYFETENDIVITVPGLTDEDWKVYLNYNYQTSGVYKIPVSNSAKTEEEIKNVIENAVGDILKNSKWKSLSTDDPLYRILHLYTSGVTFVGDDEATIVRKKLVAFEELKYEDLIKMDIEEMNSHIVALEKKVELIKAMVLVETQKSKESRDESTNDIKK